MISKPESATGVDSRLINEGHCVLTEAISELRGTRWGEICKPHTDPGLACCETVLTPTPLKLQIYYHLSLDGYRLRP